MCLYSDRLGMNYYLLCTFLFCISLLRGTPAPCSLMEIKSVKEMTIDNLEYIWFLVQLSVQHPSMHGAMQVLQ